MSTRRGRRTSRGRGRVPRFADPVDEISIDPQPSIYDPATTTPRNLPSASGIGITTPIRGATGTEPESTRVVLDENFGRQFLQMIQGAVRTAGIIPEVPISQTLIGNGVRTFSGLTGGDPTEAEDWLSDTERHMDQLGLDLHRCYLGAIFMLDGNAHTWWESVVSSVQTDRLTWDFFRECFRSRFLGERYLTQRRQQFQDLVQGDMTVSEYVIEFLKLLNWESKRHAEEVEASALDNDRVCLESCRKPSGQSAPFSRPDKISRIVPHQMSRSDSRPASPPHTVASREDSVYSTSNLSCEFCGNQHGGECRKKMGTCFGCGSSKHFLRNCPYPAPVNQTAVQTSIRS
ncbi:uncharacterized protein LOC120177580 [Hibiscus syriacus]|uniref:uncharacterized protein LOC120177580 n=1 Tax=Hibiscus syriacus TaxID=106335 RepID=UPI00192179E0|nr:uncharacterized protein LOC120177580 [Hibiscus syriacus]